MWFRHVSHHIGIDIADVSSLPVVSAQSSVDQFLSIINPLDHHAAKQEEGTDISVGRSQGHDLGAIHRVSVVREGEDMVADCLVHEGHEGC